MSTQAVDYEALANKYGATQSEPGKTIDYEALAKQHGAVESEKPPEKGTLNKIWDVMNTPVADFVLPKGMKTADMLKAAGYHALGLGEYMPGVNDEHTLSETRLNDTPTKAAIRTFVSGAVSDAAKMGASATSPLGISLAATGPLAKVPGAIGTAAKAVQAGAGAGFAGKGVEDIAEAGDENTPEAWQQRLQGGAEVAGGAAGAGSAIREGSLPARQSVAESMITKLIKPTRADVAFGKDPAGAIVREGLTANSLDDLGDKVYARAREVGAQIDKVVQSPSAQAQTIDVSKAMDPVDAEIKQAVAHGNKPLYDKLKDLKQQLTMVWAEDVQSGSIVPHSAKQMQMTPYEATLFKRQVGDLTRWNGTDPFENDLNAVKGKVFGAVKDQINSAVPEVAELNQRYADLASAGKAIERRSPVAARNSEWSLTDLGAAVSAAHYGGPAAVAAVAGKKILSSTAFKTRAAKALAGPTE